MKLTSKFANGQQIPKKYTCEGDDISPPFTFDDVPAGTKSLVLILTVNVENPPVHWHVINIPAGTKWVGEGELPPGGINATCSDNTLGYGGPCQRYDGDVTYAFRLFALDTMLNLAHTARFEETAAAMEGHILATAELACTI